jgi:hypothetical protein
MNTLLYVQLHLLESGLLFDVDRLELLLGKVSLREIEKFISRPHPIPDVMKNNSRFRKIRTKNGKQTHGYLANSLDPEVACPTELLVKKITTSVRFHSVIII